MSDVKRIVFISPYGHHGTYSGARHRVEELCKALLASNQELKIICLSPWCPPEGVKHVRFSLDGSNLKRLFKSVWLTFQVLLLRPKLVISESPIAPLSFGRFKVFHVIHDAKFATQFARKGGSAVRYMHWLSARIANKIITVSKAEKLRICSALNIAPNNVVVSYNGLSNIWLSAPLPEAGTQRDYDLLYVSNLASHKGHLSLLESLYDCSLRILFVGSDFGEKQKCVEFASFYKMDVTFISDLTEKELIEAYDNSKVFIFPSKLEGFGIPFLEARARGLPVLANDIHVFRELQNVMGGKVIDFGDKVLLIEKIRTLLLEEHIRPSLDDFLWESIAQKLVEKGLVLR